MFYPVVWLSVDLLPTALDPLQQPHQTLDQLTQKSLGRVNPPTPAALPHQVAFSSPSTIITPKTVVVLRQGSQGAVVKQLQARLQQLTYDPGPIDGQFGPRTDQAVRQFQMTTGLPVDGVVGATTWARLQRQEVSTNQAIERSSPLPHLSPVVPQLQFHPIARIAAGPDRKTLVLLAIGLAGVGLMAYRFRPEPFKPVAQLPVYYPHPVYPQQLAAVHQPQPIYPPPAAPVMTAASNLISGPAPHPECLPEFLYDLQQPQQRQALETSLQGGNPEVTPALTALLNRLGSFPAVHHGTGQPYTYLLLDDLGGCFRLCNNELWVTEAAVQWLRQDAPYSLTIRRLDSSGGIEDREFTVALSPRQLALAT